MKALFWLGLLFLLGACDMEKYPEPAGSELPEILVYCDITMLAPIEEIAAVIEAKHNCRVVILSGSSGYLLRILEINHQGDIFLPGCLSYLAPLSKLGIVTDSVVVGFNLAGFFVWPDNPKQIPAEFSSLVDPRNRVVVASPLAGSIGRQTKWALEKHQLYSHVIERALYSAADSLELTKAISSKEVDMVINWRAVKYIPGNSANMEYLPFPKPDQVKRPLIMGQLLYSQQLDIAADFLELAASSLGKSIFRKYGFLD
ncbi:MAG: substrate-binding domain-containing protein [Desulfuromonadales bacterium]|nr:substrate-binding domain-containing protein [Desulfuromonadales bacterium]